MNEEFEKYIAPIRELNTLAIANIEKLMGLQLKFIEDTTKASMETLKSAATINDAEGLKEYVSTQVSTTKQLADRAIEDSRSVVEISNNYASEVQKVVKESFKAA
jgi:phasin family protein